MEKQETMKYVCSDAIESVLKDFVSGCGVAADDKEINELWKDLAELKLKLSLLEKKP